MKTKAGDAINFLSKGSPQRIWNAMKVLASYRYSRISGRSVHWGMPIALSLEPTTACNLRCPECPSGLRSFTRPTGMLQEEIFKKVIEENASTLWYLIFYFQGEPYLHPSFTDLVSYASSKGIYTATSTNAHYLTDEQARKTVESGLDRLIISIDGTTQETYEQYRKGGRLEKVLEGTRNILMWKKKLRSSTPHVVFQFLVVGPNEHQIPEVYRLARELGVDSIGLKTAQIYDFENGSPLIPKDGRYSRYVKLADGSWSIKNQLLNHCWKMWHSCVVTWDGKVVPCCFDKDASHALGHLDSDSFSSVWKSSAYEVFRSAVLRSRSEIDICRNCTEGSKVWG